jgi:PD-(D/E)XK nuclease superfamily
LEIAPIYTVISPSEWRPAPEWMNFHYLRRAERCPRSAALRYARYAELWDKNGYPDKPTIAALTGTVVHASIARIVRTFAASGCTDINDPRCVAVLRQLGGYTRVLGEVIAKLVESLAGNPRFASVREFSLTNLQNRIPRLREELQLQLGNIVWLPESDVLSTENRQNQKSNHTSPVRLPLRRGTHFEVEVRYFSLKWRGVIDLIDVGETECRIKDFKTGTPSDDHVLQLQLYALLWLHDSELNPDGLPASKLSLCYPTGEKQIAVSSQDLNQLAKSLETRTQKVRASVTGNTARANLTADNCPDCDVRHLCTEYWTVSRALPPNLDAATKPFDDIEVVLKTRKGERTWVAECQISNQVKRKTLVLLRWTTRNFALLESIKPDTTVRLTGAMLTIGPEFDTPVINCIYSTDLVLPNRLDRS